MKFLDEIFKSFKRWFLETSTPERARVLAFGSLVTTIFWGLHLSWTSDYTIICALLVAGIIRCWRVLFLFYFGITAKTKEEMLSIRKILSNYLTTI